MTTMIVEPVVQNVLPTAVRRVSWGAIFAGVTVALVTQLLLGVLGLAIGASTIDPLAGNTPTNGLGIGAGIWFLVTGLLSLFAGGWTAGRLAGIHRPVDSALHGVLTWGIATLVTFYLLTTAVGAIMGGAARTLGQGASLIGQGAASASPALSDAIKGQMQDSGINWDSIRDEAKTMLQQTGKPELQPDAIAAKAKDAGQDAQNTAKGTAENPQAAGDNMTELMNRVFNRTTDVANAARPRRPDQRRGRPDRQEQGRRGQGRRSVGTNLPAGQGEVCRGQGSGRAEGSRSGRRRRPWPQPRRHLDLPRHAHGSGCVRPRWLHQHAGHASACHRPDPRPDAGRPRQPSLTNVRSAAPATLRREASVAGQLSLWPHGPAQRGLGARKFTNDDPDISAHRGLATCSLTGRVVTEPPCTRPTRGTGFGC